MITAKLNIWGKDVELAFSREKYANNDNLAIQAWLVEKGVVTEPYTTVTVNLSKRKENHAFIDSNNCPREIIDWLVDNGYAICTFYFERSGYCEYYEYKFTDEFLTKVVS